MKIKNKNKKQKAKKKFTKPKISIKPITDSVISVFGTYGSPTPSGFGS